MQTDNIINLSLIIIIKFTPILNLKAQVWINNFFYKNSFYKIFYDSDIIQRHEYTTVCIGVKKNTKMYTSTIYNVLYETGTNIFV